MTSQISLSEQQNPTSTSATTNITEKEKKNNDLANYYKNLGTKYEKDYKKFEANYSYSFIEPKINTYSKQTKCIQNTSNVNEMKNGNIQNEITTQQNCKIKASLYSSINKSHLQNQNNTNTKGFISRKVLSGSYDGNFHAFYPKEMGIMDGWKNINPSNLLDEINDTHFSAMFLSKIDIENDSQINLQIIKDPYSTIYIWISNTPSNFYLNNATFSTKNFENGTTLNKLIRRRHFIRIYYEFNGNRFANKKPLLTIKINNSTIFANAITLNDLMNDSVYYFMQPVENGLVNCSIITNPTILSSVPDEKIKVEKIIIAIPNVVYDGDYVLLKKMQNNIQFIFEKSGSVIRTLDANHNWRFVFEETNNELKLSFYKFLKNGSSTNQNQQWQLHETLISIKKPKAIVNENWNSTFAKNSSFISAINSYDINEPENRITQTNPKFTNSGKYKLTIDEAGKLVILYNIEGCNGENDGTYLYLIDGTKYSNTFMYLDKGENIAQIKPPSTIQNLNYKKENFLKYGNNLLFLYNPDLINKNIYTIDDCYNWILTLSNVIIGGFTFFKTNDGKMGCSIIPADKYDSPINPQYVKDIKQYPEIQTFEYFYYQPKFIISNLGLKEMNNEIERNILTVEDINGIKISNKLNMYGQSSKNDVVNFTNQIKNATTNQSQQQQQMQKTIMEGFNEYFDVNDVQKRIQQSKDESQKTLTEADKIQTNTQNVKSLIKTNNNYLQQIISKNNSYQIKYDPNNLHNGFTKSDLADAMKEDGEYIEFYQNLQYYSQIMAIVALGFTALFIANRN